MKSAGGTGGGTVKLGCLFEEALRCLASTDLDGANAALKKAHAEAARSVGMIDGAADGRVSVGPREAKRARG